MTQHSARFILEPVVGLLVLLGLVGGLTWYLDEPERTYIQGEADATQIDLAVKVAGRVTAITVREGDVVKKGDRLVDLDIPEVHARLQQAAAAEKAAAAQRDKALAGTRRQAVEAALNRYHQARESADLARKTYDRVQRLYADGVVPAQRRDESYALWVTAREAAAAAKSTHEMALEGAREEDLRATAALADQAQGAVREARSYLDETHLDAPIDGEVVHVLADPGELVSPGYPLVTITDLSDIWISFNIREDHLPGIRMGRRFAVQVPALGQNAIAVEVCYISPQGDFATWRATSASGGFDLKTFEVRARPVRPIDGLRPGMSAIVPLSEFNHAGA